MPRKNGILVLMVVATLCFLLLFFNYREVPHARPLYRYELNLDSSEDTFLTPIEQVLKIQKRELEAELSSYKFSHGGLSNFTLADGGKPIRTVIITTWRSGSTFLGDVLNAVPGNYYHYEPLLHYGIVQIRGAPHSSSALQLLKSLMKCDYSDLEEYLSYGKSHNYLFSHNSRLWNKCENYPLYCWDPEFLNQFCKLFPFQSLKTVRLRLWLAEELLKDTELNVKVVLLIRDPRGTLQSRKHRDWCPGNPDCDQPKNLCADMVSDYSAAINLQTKYPTRFKAIRYEDLSLDPYQYVKEVLNFSGLEYHEEVEKFLDSHTKINVGGVSSTFRDSKSTPFHWKMDLNQTEIEFIEKNCDIAMKLWGYVKVDDFTSIKDFNPIRNYKIN